jgi:hypothetical protein
MKWFRKKPPPEVESHLALQEAQAGLSEIKKRSPEVQRVTDASKQLLQKNHLVEQLGGIMWGAQ